MSRRKRHSQGLGMNQIRPTILNGKKEISRYVGRSWSTIRKWIDRKDFPARKLDGIWEADAELIIQWRQRQIAERASMGGQSGLA